MYTVLLVDDERMILEGISSIVDWQAYETNLIGKAMNGIEGYQFIKEQQPDIVISDITMPGLDGIGLIKKAQAEFPEIKWIFLSGYNEFEYARQAMRYGVKHYLLKPCNEQQIAEALQEVIQEIDTSEQEKKLSIKMEWREILQQLFNGHPITENLSAKVHQLMGALFQGKEFGFFMLVAEDKLTYEECIDIKQAVVKEFGEELVIDICLDNKWITSLPRHVLINHYIAHFLSTNPKMQEHRFTAIIINDYNLRHNGSFPNIYDLAEQLFYQDRGSTIDYASSFRFQEKIPADLEVDIDKVLRMLRSEKTVQLSTYFQAFVEQAKQQRISPKLVKGYAVQLYLILMNKYPHVTTEDRVEAIEQIENDQYSSELLAFFTELFKRLITYSKTSVKYSKIVQQMLAVIEEELSNSELSLQGIASDHLYMNADYLGKTFKAEVGQGFSSYVTNARINKAVEIIENERDIKVFELAEKIGFGNNPQYFSQLFKRIKGSTPSEIIKTRGE
ncbi:response regulator transcription factor [Gracilibacillus alcaliphilus]|uniref:response regulator transcription factor n=1 Tax=Gracilibacillus alcaliphilus TaxID=1401441 RepID=UPI00195A1A05|nr:response regulator [Gracilibacillus alcaliphilus]MBM7675946.1 two-component system response regulator YesN [Gracilibacillus alcaliphilus]